MPLSPPNLLRVTAAALKGNPVRSLLTMVGVFMGVLAVNGTLQARNVSQRIIEQQLLSQEAPQLMGWPGEMTVTDQEWLTQQLGDVAASTGAGGEDFGTVSYGEQSALLSVLYVDRDFLTTKGRSMMQGRFFNAHDFAEFRAVAVIDEQVANQLFLGQNPLGQQLTFGGGTYRVIGVMDARPLEKDGQVWSMMVLPLSLYHAQVGRRQMDAFSIRPGNWQTIEQQEERLMTLLEARFPDRDLWLHNNGHTIVRQREILTLVSRGLLGLGLVALIISGVGIANITLASVLERTPEIGLRRAIGATQGDILRQFLLEAIVLSTLGGLGAIATVEATTRLVVRQFALPYEFQPATVSLSLGAAIVVGAGSSLLPAYRASRIEPMAALRNE
jgi:putative ABC transport system permease protein